MLANKLKMIKITPYSHKLYRKVMDLLLKELDEKGERRSEEEVIMKQLEQLEKESSDSENAQ